MAVENEMEEELDIPHPVCILKATGDHKFELDIAALEKLLLQDHIKDKKVILENLLLYSYLFRKYSSNCINPSITANMKMLVFQSNCI